MKPYAEAFYKSSSWVAARKAYLERVGGLCERCLEKGLIVPATMVHHVEHITPENINDESITLNPANFLALCRECHAKAHEKAPRYKFDDTGHMI